MRLGEEGQQRKAASRESGSGQRQRQQPKDGDQRHVDAGDLETARADGLHDGDLLGLLVEQRRERVGDQECAQENDQRAQHIQHPGHGIHIGCVGMIMRAAHHRSCRPARCYPRWLW